MPPWVTLHNAQRALACTVVAFGSTAAYAAAHAWPAWIASACGLVAFVAYGLNHELGVQSEKAGDRTP